ncbi:hypothetical protein FHU10_1564 [Serratia fonticola]|uniref:Uncharacterized protein n=1 Tax=Serratia fonticola TaxID=47917 RepID=A0A559T3A8_SERFO|nr:hypothetical protein FHU11_5166 [Serratia fonticola]TVZ69093.1 hypothetical protein FHU10_1564 [Serratia fonticola]
MPIPYLSISPANALCGFVHKNKNALSFNCNKKSK